MPLVGTLCCQSGSPQTFDHCMAESRAGRCQHTVPLLASMQKNSEARKGIGISTSVLGTCPRQFVLSERNNYYEDPELCYPRWIGTFSHYAVELGGPYPGIVQEHRFYRMVTVDGVAFELSGQPDWIDVDAGTIEDSKFVAFAPAQPYDSHAAQLNVYAWLVEGGYVKDTAYTDCTRGCVHNPVNEETEFETLRVNYYHGPSGKPKRRHTTYRVDRWSDAAVESYVQSKLLPHAKFIKTGNTMDLQAPEDFSFWSSCPFLHENNPGRCCMAVQFAQKQANTEREPRYMEVDTSMS